MNKLKQALTGQEKNFVLPFFWMHGETHQELRNEIEKINSCGIRALCMESRPHPNFAKEQWWGDVDVIMEQARRLNMRVWLLDDDKFPTGHANGAFEKRPELSKLYLAQRHTDIIGPTNDTAVLVAPFLPSDAKLLAVLVCPRPDPDSTLIDTQKIVNITHTLNDGFVRVTLPNGMYRLMVIFTTHINGGRADYVNIIDSESVRVLINEVYETHYARYKDDFGKTFAGFFSDEPELGNTTGYDFHDVLGAKPDMKLPWSTQLENMLCTAWGDCFENNLVALWYNTVNGAGNARYEYMDCVTQLVQKCFSAQIGDWCTAHGVEYIGHVIEDDNAHTRLGCSTGHYFRHMQGQHMAGIDVVHHQILPGFTGKVHRWVGWETDGEFFHFGLARLGASAAKLDDKKQGRTMCEIFGNYGWAEGIGLMKWLVDHMLVRGVNYFVPHAFSPKFPDRDCPPHFYANGNNPQFKFFGNLMQYINRVSHLISDGHEYVNAAILYHAEAEWYQGEEAMLFQKPLRALMEQQLSADILPTDCVISATFKNSQLMVGDNAYKTLIIPSCTALPRELALVLQQAQASGVNIIFVDNKPIIDMKAKALPDNFIECGRVEPIENLATIVGESSPSVVKLTQSNKDLRFFCTQQVDGDVMMFFNESVSQNIQTTVTLSNPCLAIARYDAVNNLQVIEQIANNSFNLQLAQGEAAIIITLHDAPKRAMPKRIISESIELNNEWSIYAFTQENSTQLALREVVKTKGTLPNMNAATSLQDFVGTFKYESFFQGRAGVNCSIRLPLISDAASIKINDIAVGIVLGQSGSIDVSKHILNGKNTICIEIANTLVWRLKDPVSVFAQIPPTGMLRAPILEYYE